MPLSPRAARLIRQSGHTEQQLRDLCKLAMANDPDAMRAVHALASATPGLRQVLAGFGRATSKSKANAGRSGRKKMAKVKGNWHLLTGKAAGRVSIVSGGLPSLGKRK